MRTRILHFSVILLLALASAGCTRKDGAKAQQIESESASGGQTETEEAQVEENEASTEISYSNQVAPIFAAKKKAGMKYGIVEVEEYNFDPLVSVEKSLEYLKTTNF